MSVTNIAGLTAYQAPTYRDSSEFVSQWKFLDVTSSGIDSQFTNHLIASGSPTNVAGMLAVSGVQFDGVNDCFYIPFNQQSGLVDLKESGTLPTVPVLPKFAIMGRLYCGSFASEQHLIGVWSSGTPASTLNWQWQLTITQTSGFAFRYQRDNIPGAWTTIYSQDNLLPINEWFTFAFSYRASTTAGQSNISFIVNNTEVSASAGASFVENASSGTFCIGAACPGAGPSGFFTGRMEDIWFFNGKGISFEEYNYYCSGNQPYSVRPTLSTAYPTIEGLWRLNFVENRSIGHLTNAPTLREEINDQCLFASGSNSGLTTFLPGAYDGTRGSGLARPSITSSQWVRPVAQIPKDTIKPIGPFTLMYWFRSVLGTSNTETIFGINSDGANAAVFEAKHGSMNPTFGYSFQGGANSNITADVKISQDNWVHLAYVFDPTRGSIRIYASGQEITYATTPLINNSGMFLKSESANGYNWWYLGGAIDEANDGTGFSGILDEVVLVREALSSGQIYNFYTNQSGFILNTNKPSGMLGGYERGVDTHYASGKLGGYIIGPNSNSKIVGAWISGIPDRGSGMLGGWVAGIEDSPISATFHAFFNLYGRTKSEFDSMVKVYKTQFAEFDAMAVVYIKETPPIVSIIVPNISQSGNTVPVTYQFEATASGYNNKRILYTQWFFSDVPITSGSTTSSSGTYKTAHTFTRSGLYDVIFMAIDENGLVGSDRRIISTASGLTLPEITLTASPISGIVPLTVGFSGSISNVPAPIIDKSIYFGDGMYSATINNINRRYIAPGLYCPVLRVIDNRGVVVTDSIVLGFNN